MKDKGFTLIELMIVIAIIAIIAAIAIPSLIGHKIGANETAAVGCLRDITGNQASFCGNDREGDNVKDFALSVWELYSSSGNNFPNTRLIPLSLARADSGGHTTYYPPAADLTSKAGYFYAMVTATAAEGKKTWWGCVAFPSVTGKTGNKVFWTDVAGDIRYRAVTDDTTRDLYVASAKGFDEDTPDTKIANVFPGL